MEFDRCFDSYVLISKWFFRTLEACEPNTLRYNDFLSQFQLFYNAVADDGNQRQSSECRLLNRNGNSNNANPYQGVAT